VPQVVERDDTVLLQIERSRGDHEAVHRGSCSGGYIFWFFLMGLLRFGSSFLVFAPATFRVIK
jgi:hypothetical protein